MGDGYNFQVLKAAILEVSRATDWELAKLEWALISITEADEPETCLCGHRPIMEICTIKNTVTKAVRDVGNVCVKRFFGVRSDLIFTALKRIRADDTKSLNADSIAFFFERSVLNDWEYGFCQNTMRKKALTAPQIKTRKNINQKVISAVETRGLRGPD